jgi:hypothetical protein
MREDFTITYSDGRIRRTKWTLNWKRKMIRKFDAFGKINGIVPFCCIMDFIEE